MEDAASARATSNAGSSRSASPSSSSTSGSRSRASSKASSSRSRSKSGSRATSRSRSRASSVDSNTEESGPDAEILKAAAEEDGAPKVVELLKDGANAMAKSRKKGGLSILHLLMENLADGDQLTQVLEAMGEERVKEAINVVDDTNNTPLLRAAVWDRAGQGNIVRILLSHGADLKTIGGENDRNALHFAAVNGAVEVIEELLKHKDEMDVNLKDVTEMTALDGACWKGRFDIVKLLYDAGADINVRDNEKWTPLRTACAFNHPEIIEFLLDEGADIGAGDDIGLTCLHAVARDNEMNLAELLLRRGAYVNARDTYGCTPLDLVAWKGHEEMTKLLLDNGAAIDVKDLEGVTPLMRACQYEHEQLADYLISRGADRFLEDIRGKNALDSANRSKHGRIMRRLIQDGVFSDHPDASNWTPLMTCCRFGYKDSAEILLEKGANINRFGDMTGSSLIRASYGGQVEIVELLLNWKPTKVDVDCQGEDEETPLHLACHSGHYEVVDLLLKVGKADINLVDHKGRTALHQACLMGYEPIVRLLLEHGASLQDCDNEKYMAVHVASSAKIEDQTVFDPEEGIFDTCRGVDMPWVKERRPREEGCYYEVLKLLLEHGADPLVTVADDMMALHLAARIDDPDRMRLLLTKIPAANRILRTTEGKTALCLALEARNQHSALTLLQILASVDFGIKDIEQDSLLWAASSEDTHEIALLLFRKSIRAPKVFKDEKLWGPMDWAAHRGMPDVLWALLCSSEWSPETDRKRMSAKAVALKAREAAIRKGKAAKKASDPAAQDRHRVLSMRDRDANQKGQKLRGGEVEKEKTKEGPAKGVDQPADQGAVPSNPEDMSPRDAVAREEWQQIPPPAATEAGTKGLPSQKHNPSAKQEEAADKKMQHDVYDLIVDMLRDPPIRQTSGPKLPFQRPTIDSKLRTAIEEYEAAIVDFYAQDGRSGFLSRFRSVAETIYDTGPSEIMRKARETMQSISSGMGGKDNDSRHEQQKTYTKDDLQFTWIHLPANNMKWMNDLILRIYIDTEQEESAFREVSDFMRKSWVQTPDRVSKTRFMKPRCVQENDDKSMALYIPYLTFSKECKDHVESEPRTKYEKLLRDYKDEAIHGSRTLDEFYYHFSSEERFMQDMRRRNLDQVVTKAIEGPPEKKQVWTSVRVDQVWLWMLDESTIITSSTHRVDGDEDPFFAGIVDLLAKSGERRSEQSQPANASEMSELIVDFCVGFFDRQPRQRSHETQIQRRHGSVRQIFSDSINKTAIEEADLFRKFTQEKLERENGRKPKNKRRKEAMGTAASLFRNIKDIRDELNILKAVAESQDSVSSSLQYLRGQDIQSARSVIRDIKEMDEIARRIQNSVNTTLTLEQNDIAISQAQEGVRQGRTLMVFTVVTILFLPMSFLTSLFALDVASFQRTPDWAFAVIFCVSVGICMPLASYAFYSDKLINFLHETFTGKQRKKTGPAITISETRPQTGDHSVPVQRIMPVNSFYEEKDEQDVTIMELKRSSEHDRRGDFHWPLVRRKRGPKTLDEEALDMNETHLDTKAMLASSERGAVTSLPPLSVPARPRPSTSYDQPPA